MDCMHGRYAVKPPCVSYSICPPAGSPAGCPYFKRLAIDRFRFGLQWCLAKAIEKVGPSTAPAFGGKSLMVWVSTDLLLCCQHSPKNMPAYRATIEPAGHTASFPQHHVHHTALSQGSCAALSCPVLHCRTWTSPSHPILTMVSCALHDCSLLSARTDGLVAVSTVPSACLHTQQDRKSKTTCSAPWHELCHTTPMF